MTQTIHNITVDTENQIAMDVYYHPDNKNAKLDDPKLRLKYTLIANKFTKQDIVDYILDSDPNINEIEALKEAFYQASKINQDFIYRAEGTAGYEDYYRFFATRDDVISDFYDQTV